MIDDSEHWQSVTQATVQDAADIELIAYHGVTAAWMALQGLAHDDPDRFPDIILMDYYLGDGVGAELVEDLRGLPLHAERRPIILAHSSSSHGNRRIMMAGADEVVAKIGDSVGGNPELAAWLDRLRSEF